MLPNRAHEDFIIFKYGLPAKTIRIEGPASRNVVDRESNKANALFREPTVEAARFSHPET
ncbi:hypothetical protein CZ765_07150 [Corynebacterium casei]|nr:hypothetical protein CZ765_07150 [Corynebacterium casei]